MKVFKCGTIINIKLSNIEGMITSCAIRFTAVVYEVAYFLNGEQYVLWMNENEFTVIPTIKKQTIGYKNESP